MRKKTAVLLAAGVIASSPAMAGDKQKRFEIAITHGIYAVDQGRYSEAAEWLEKALAVKPGNSDALLALGIAKSRAGLYREAEGLLRRALARRPHDQQTREELAAVLNRLGRTEEAAGIAPAETASAPAGEDSLGAGATARRGITVDLLAGVQYDTNTVLEPSNPSYDWEDKSDWRAVAALDAEWRFYRGDAATLAVGYRIYHGANEHNHDFDLTLNRLGLSGEYRFNPAVSAKLSYAFDHSMARGDTYGRNHTITLGLKGKGQDGAEASVYWTHEFREFENTPTFPVNDHRNGGRDTIELTRKTAPRHGTSLTLSLAYIRDNTDRSWWDSRGPRITLAAEYNGGGFSGFLQGQYSDLRYSGEDPAAAEKRHDKVQKYSCGLLWPFSRRYAAGLTETLVLYRSNIGRFDYERSVSGLSLIARF